MFHASCLLEHMHVLFSLFPSLAINSSFYIVIVLILFLSKSSLYIIHYSFKQVHKIHKTQLNTVYLDKILITIIIVVLLLWSLSFIFFVDYYYIIIIVIITVVVAVVVVVVIIVIIIIIIIVIVN